VAAIVSIASGKGGVGKSTTVSNLGLLLARRGLSTVLIDLDVGGADLHIMFGELAPKVTLSDFLARRVETLAETAMPLAVNPKLRLIAGTGDTLRNTNPASQTKRRLEKHVRELTADVILLDIGAGSNLHALDFFLWADVPVVVSTPDPTSVMDLYRFVKLAAIRRVTTAIGGREQVSEQIADEDVASIEQLLANAGAAGPEVEARAKAALTGFRPALVFNSSNERDRTAGARLAAVIQKFLGTPADVLGQVPEDPAVGRAVRKFLPVVEREPESPAARGFAAVEAVLYERLKPFLPKAHVTRPYGR
jgi:flagellar biosynthesis protein FlhG